MARMVTRGGMYYELVPCIRTEPSRYGHRGSVHEALRRIQAIHPNPEGGARSNVGLKRFLE